MAGKQSKDRGEAPRRRAQALITEALDLLNAHSVSEPAAAHLALALEELRHAGKNERTSPAE